MTAVDEFLDKITIQKEGKEIVITEKRVREMITKLLENMNKEAEFRDDFGMNTRLVGQLIEMKKTFWPATLKTLQGNIDFNSSLDKWFLLQSELLNKSKEQELTCEVINNEKD